MRTDQSSWWRRGRIGEKSADTLFNLTDTRFDDLVDSLSVKVGCTISFRTCSNFLQEGVVNFSNSSGFYAAKIHLAHSPPGILNTKGALKFMLLSYACYTFSSKLIVFSSITLIKPTVYFFQTSSVLEAFSTPCESLNNNFGIELAGLTVICLL